MDKATAEQLLTEAKQAGSFRRVEVKSKHLKELCEHWLESITVNERIPADVLDDCINVFNFLCAGADIPDYQKSLDWLKGLKDA